MSLIVKNKEKIILIFFCFVVSLICLSVCSKNSFLYAFNDWGDENSFFTIGRGWLNGMIPYRDLIDQKGPLLYFLFFISAIINNNSFIGVFLFEVISLVICLYYSSKIIELYLKRKSSYLIVQLFASIITSCPFFTHGGSAEEFCLPLLMITLYNFLIYFKNRTSSKKNLFWTGFIAGCIFMIKYTLIGFWVAFMFCIFMDLVLKKEYKKSIISCLWFLLGMFIPIVVFVIYFSVNHSLKNFVDIYILFNKNNYDVKLGLFARLKSLIGIFLMMLKMSFIVFNLIYVGILYFILSSKFLNSFWGKISFLLFIICGIVTVYYGCKEYVYYFIIFTPFCLLGLIGLEYQLEGVINNKIKYGMAIIIVLIMTTYLLSKSGNLYYMEYEKEDLIQYKFANIIKSNNGKTLLNYGFLDGGFYLTAGILPNTKYYMQFNAIMPEMENELSKKISAQEFDYIVVRSYEGYNPVTDLIKDNYKLIVTEEGIFEGKIFVYYLYQKRNEEL